MCACCAQFQRFTHNRLIEIYGQPGATPPTLSHDATKTVHFLRYLEHTILPAHAGARAKITLFSDEVLSATENGQGDKQLDR
jgi:hypothetical protein